MQHRLQLTFLGPPSAALDGRPVAFPTRKALALLVYLALEQGPQPREKLAALFWPDFGPVESRQALRTTLARLRRAIEPAADGAERSPWLAVAGGTIRLLPNAGLEVDAWTVESALRASKLQAADPRRLLALLEDVVGLWRGDFLDGFSLADAPEFDEWATTQRAYWLRRGMDTLDLVSRLQFDAGDPTSALETATRWVARDPLDEAAYRRLMRLHFARGDRAAALQAFDACSSTLMAALRARPVLETAKLAEWMRSAPPPTAPSEDGAFARSLELPFVGRESQHAALAEAFRRAVRAEAVGAVIEGEAGIGKSRLALAFENWAAAQGALILRGRAFEAGGRLPYQPIVQALRPRLNDASSGSGLVDDVWLAELSRLVPELREGHPDLPLPLADDTAARGRLYEAVVRVGSALAARAPVVLSVDDVQWADAATLDLLAYASHRWGEAGAPLFLLLNARSEDLATAPDLRAWLADLDRSRAMVRLSLATLTFDATARLVAILTGEERPELTGAVERVARRLFDETNGQPFYLAETLAMLEGEGALSFTTDAVGTRRLDANVSLRSLTMRGRRVPPRVREVITVRLGRLSRIAGELLTAGAVLGQDFRFRHACLVANLDEDAALPALDELGRAGLVRADADPLSARPRYAFGHDKIRDVVYTEAGAARRQVFHRRAFAMLRDERAPAAVVAHHAIRADMVDAAFEWSLLAGDEALGLFAVRDAIAHYERARDVLASDARGLSIAPLAAQGRLYRQLGRAFELVDEFARAREAYTSLLTTAREHADPSLECAALSRLATVTVLSSVDFETAAALLRQARDVAARSGNLADVGEVEWSLAQVGFYQLEAIMALEHGEAALRLARDLNLADLEARSHNVLAYGFVVLQDWDSVEAHAVAARDGFAAVGNRALVADSQSQLAMAHAARGRHAESIREGQEAYRTSLEIENGWGRVSSSVQLALGLLDAGRYAEALAIARENVETARTRGSHMLPSVLARLGTASRALFDLDAACAAHEEALVAAERNPVQVFAALCSAELCADFALIGEWTQAHRCALRAAMGADRSLLYMRHGAWFEVEALVRGGDAMLALRVVDWLQGQSERNPRARVPYLRALAVLANLKGDDAQAHASLTRARDVAMALDLPGELWTIDAEIASICVRLGQRGCANEASARAREVVRAVASRLDDDALRTSFLDGALARIPPLPASSTSTGAVGSACSCACRTYR